MDAWDDLFRRERPRIIATLYRVSQSLDAAEEAFQEAVLSALMTWARSGAPENPGAWLTTAAKNHLLQAERRHAVREAKAPFLQTEASMEPPPVESISDDQLRLVFTCCHPDLPQESQVALTLKVVCGFSTDELARAFLVPEPTLAQRIVRAKRTIEERQLAYSVPGRRDLTERLAAVLAVVYLIFNEGHDARSGPLMRLDLQAEALRLGRLLCELLPTEPDVFGVYALVAFGVARAATRADAHGELRLLSEQDRAQWDRTLIQEGLLALQRARRLAGGGSYVLQAEIAAAHVMAPSWEATNWSRIVQAYDALLALGDSPVVSLNRAVAVMMRDGPEAGLTALRPLEEPLARYHLFYATRADFLRRLGKDARPDYRRARELVTNDAERAFLDRKIRELGPE